MDKKVYLTLILFFSLSVMAGAGASFAADRSYTIPILNEDLFVQSDGTLHVVETIHYSFSGTYNGIYRDIPVTSPQQLTNITVSADGAYTSYKLIDQGTTKRIQVYLYSDAAKNTPITNRNVNVTIEYDFLHGIKSYNDIAELQYQLVGTSWAVDIGQVVANIHLNSNTGVQYWLNPPYFAAGSSWDNNTLHVTSTNVPSGQYFEVRMVIPKSQFAANPVNANIINQNGLNEILKIQKDYQNSLNFKTAMYEILAVLMFLALFIPLFIYLRFGREPKIDYRAEYERDIPTDDPPAIVNAICGPGFSKKVGVPDMDGFKATIMDLINRKYFILQNQPSEKEGYGADGSMFLKVNPEQDSSTLKRFELNVMNFLTQFEEDGVISMDAISDDLSNRESAKSFRETYMGWVDNIKNQFLNDSELNKFFNKKGDSYIKIFGGIGLAVSVIVFICALMDSLPAADIALVMSIVLGVVAIISLILPEKIAGQWTTYGEEYDAKWNNFKKYIKDFSLIKEYPPESIVIWNKYLVYATALGAADAVRKAMELYVPKDELQGSDIYMFHYYGGYLLLSNAFDTGISTATAGSGGDFGGVGDVGGGFGGGGGGAF
ncbi:DUF2207 domain-containing protein [Methanobacterium spitsbergense]|uniref:DUF2207 domain-containing protein n=1 Tax=Methanobacterium spitsbergense TaxID=2874285 RepID=A0A8T5UXQ5_9EURY|nr:DUF2207 domain-containing protein [Methanobacterium spitsbergense]MBZ2166696.1 DUF2207 domain-containing protein [Methanobacterium spitsbergense]